MKARVLIVDDEASDCELFAIAMKEAGLDAQTATSAQAALALIAELPPDMVVSDVRMPGMDGIELLRSARQNHPELPFLFVTGYPDVHDALAAGKLGAVDYLAKPVDLDELVAAVRDMLGITGEQGEFKFPADALGGIVAESPAIRVVFRDAYRIARSEATVLLSGETGVGKEVVARFIHQNSPRRDGLLVPLNCAAVPRTLLESELFGHKKGAFTGAWTDRPGCFREADGGTLFLDEIADLPLELQPSLLRAIETRRIRPVGGDREVETDFRLIASTNRDLLSALREGRFREDLYYRLNVTALEVPPLREREEDILPLARHFLAQQGAGKSLSKATARVLQAYRWPGNVREMTNCVERASLLSRGDAILPEHLPPEIRQAAEEADREGESGGHVRTIEQAEIEAIRQALKKTGGNRTEAARILGISRRGLVYKLKRFEI